MMSKLRLLFILTVLIANMLTTNTVMGKNLVQITHVVKTGEDITYIAKLYITPDRYLPEFQEGIVELNWDTVFRYRCFKEVRPGDKLRINYWTDKEWITLGQHP